MNNFNQNNQSLKFRDLFGYLSIELGRQLTKEEKRIAFICWNKAQEVQAKTIHEKYKLVPKI